MSRSSIRPRLVAIGVVCLATTGFVLAQVPQAPPASQGTTGSAAGLAANADSLAKYASPANLQFYLEFEGLDPHNEAWSKSSAARILSDTKTGAMFDEILSQVLEQFLAQAPNRKMSGAELSALLQHATKAGFVLAMHNDQGKTTQTLVVRDVMKPETKPVVGRFLASVGLVGPGMQPVDKPGGRRVVTPTAGPSWWVESNTDLVLSDEVDAVIAALEGKSPNMASQPRRTKLKAKQAGFEPVGWAFLEMTGIPLPPEAVQMGFDGVKAIQVQWGLDGKAMKSILDIEAPSPRKGMLSLVDQPTFAPTAIPSLPDKFESCAIMSIEPDQTLMKLASVMEQMGQRDAAGGIKGMEGEFRSATKLDLRKDVLNVLGPKVVAYTVPDKKGVSAALSSLNPLSGMQIPRFVILVDVKDQKVLNKSITQLMSFANKELASVLPTGAEGAEASAPGQSGRRPGASSGRTTTAKKAAPAAEFKMTKPTPLTYQLSLAPQLAMLFNAKVTIVLSPKHLIIASEPGLASDAFTLDEKAAAGWQPTGDYVGTLDGLPSSLVMLALSDPRESAPKALAELPMTIKNSLAAAFAPASTPVSISGPTPGGVAGGPQGANLPGGMRRPGGMQPQGAAPGGGLGPQGLSPGGGAAAGPQGLTPGGGAAPGLPGNAPPGAAGSPGSQATGGPGVLASLNISVPSDKIPTAESIKPFLFPSSMALAVDDRGVRLISRDAFFDVQLLTTALNAMAAQRRMAGAGTNPAMAGVPSGPPAFGPPGGRTIPGPGGGRAPAGATPGAGGGGAPGPARPD